MTKKSRLRIFSLRVIKLLNVVLIVIPFAASWFFYYDRQIADTFGSRGDALILCLYAAFFWFLARIYGAFSVSFNKTANMLFNQAISFCISDFLIYCVICLLAAAPVNILPGLLALAGQFVLSFVWCILSRLWYYATFPPQKTLIVEDFRRDLDEMIVRKGLSKKFDVLKKTDSASCISDLSILDEFDTVFISGVTSHNRNVLLKYCAGKNVEVYFVPRIGDAMITGAAAVNLFNLPMMKTRGSSSAPFEYLLVKRFLDILLSAASILLLWPLMLIIAIVVKAYDGGPVIYTQKRLTNGGRVFNLRKFRSMRVDAEKDGIARLSSGENDDRVTPPGRFLRKTRLDELPQLFNILSGSMSIVGPRPERPEIAEQYEKELPEFRLRLQAKAGLTGYAQVYGKYNTEPYDKLVLDLMYISHQSLIEDIKIVLATVGILFQKSSTEGVRDDRITASGIAIPPSNNTEREDAEQNVSYDTECRL